MTIARRMRSYDLIDRFLGFLGPIALILTLLMWLAMFVVGFALMFHPPADDFAAAIGHSGAATFTLGITTTTAGSSTAISVTASATGLIVIALTIIYLPAPYAVIRRRETLGRQLGAHSGSPPWGPHVLLAYHYTGALDALAARYTDWGRWASEAADGHTKFPVLNQFRLPRGKYHWLLSLLATLDAAGLDPCLRPSDPEGEARLFLLSGITCAEDLAASMQGTDTLDSGVTVTNADASVVSLLTKGGYPTERSADEAWPTFQAWRERYISTICQLLDMIVAPPAPWSGSRSLLVTRP
jgi:hypothetical protein